MRRYRCISHQRKLCTSWLIPNHFILEFQVMQKIWKKAHWATLLQQITNSMDEMKDFISILAIKWRGAGSIHCWNSVFIDEITRHCLASQSSNSKPEPTNMRPRISSKLFIQLLWKVKQFQLKASWTTASIGWSEQRKNASQWMQPH